MIVIGVTGGIGSGKSTVSSILEELGAILIDADSISKQVVEPEERAYFEVIKTFGESILNEDKSIDRKKLAEIVFTSDEKKRLLEGIIHKEVIRVIKERIELFHEYGFNGTVVLDVPIPVEDGFLNVVDKVWVVVSEDKKRISRVIKRGGISLEDAQNRINSQLSQEEYMKLADVVLENNGDLLELREKVKNLHSSLMLEVYKNKNLNDGKDE
ncbi:MAG: dephospho-CoA kinase [Acetivibrionales bacterium]|jgi:dephospho-CoA kinase|nr:dephospho-CoA kinase [Clostridiaceae bacterium]